MRANITPGRTYALGATAALLFGYDNGIIGAALLFIPDSMPLTPWLKGLVVSATLIGAIVGSVGSGPASDRRGRREILFSAGAVFAIGALGAGLAPDALTLVLFRFVIGLGIGIASVIVPLYLAEMASADDRGVVTSLNQYMIIVGTALAAGAGYALAFAESWRWMILLGVFPAVALLLGTLFTTDTPRSLVRRGYPDRAREVLVQLRPDESQAGRELAEIIALEKQQQVASARPKLSAPWVRNLLLLGAMLAIFQQLSGINTIVYYAPTVLTEFGLSNHAALLFTFLNGILNIGTIAVVVQSKLVDKRGRKPMLLAGLIGMALSLLAVGIAAMTLSLHSKALFGITIAAFVLFTNTFSATWGPVLWVVLAEIFPLSIRGAAMALATLFNWLTNAFVSMTFPVFTAAVGDGVVFAAYAVVGFVMIPVVWRMVPETTGRSLESLERTFRGPDVMPNTTQTHTKND